MASSSLISDELRSYSNFMNFRAPHMTYAPRQLQDWEKFIAFTLVLARYDIVNPVAAGVIRHRDGPMGEMIGENRPPLMMQEQTPGQVFSGTLVYLPAEAPDITVIEHPLDEVGAEDFPKSLAKVLPDKTLITFWSDLDTATRQEHGFKVTHGSDVQRYVRLTRGYENGHWTWDVSGQPQDFEDTDRLAAKSTWHRLDRPLLFQYVTAFGLDPARSLFGRDFAQSVLYRPLVANDPVVASEMTSDHAIAAEAAEFAGVRSMLPEMDDAEFAEAARSMASMSYWDRELSVIRRKASDSSQRAKTARGREKAQWRVVEGLQKWRADMVELGMTRGINWLARDFDEVMKELGPKTDAYKAYRELFPRRWEFWC